MVKPKFLSHAYDFFGQTRSPKKKITATAYMQMDSAWLYAFYKTAQNTPTAALPDEASEKLERLFAQQVQPHHGRHIFSIELSMENQKDSNRRAVMSF